MSRVVLPLTGPALAATFGGASGLIGTVLDSPGAFARIAPGTVISGVVIGRDAAGLLSVRTDGGILALATGANPPPGSRVTLEVRVSGSRLQVLILAVEPDPAAGSRAPAAAPPLVAPTASSARAGPSPPPPSGTPPSDIPAAAPASASPTRSSPPGPPPAGAPAVRATVIAPTGLPLLLRQAPHVGAAASRAAPGGGAAPARGEAAPTSPPTPSPAAAASRAVAGAPAPLRVGAEVAVHILGPAAPVPASGPPARPAPPGPAVGAAPFTATVLAVTPAGNPVLETPLGLLLLDGKAALAPGARLAIEVAALPAPAALLPGLAQPMAPARGWPALSEAFALLARVGAPAAAVVALAASPLPQLGPRLASGLLRFLAAAPEPEALARWLATLREPLERAGQSELFSRLQQEIGQIARPGEGGDWRALALPLQGESGLLPAMLYLRRQPRDGAATGERGEAGTRFVLEVELSRLGALQLDGLVRPRRFDLMLRSHKPLTAEMERDIAAIFDEARAIGRFAGSLAFATVASFPIRPLEEIGRPGGGVMV